MMITEDEVSVQKQIHSAMAPSTDASAWQIQCCARRSPEQWTARIHALFLAVRYLRLLTFETI